MQTAVSSAVCVRCGGAVSSLSNNARELQSGYMNMRFQVDYVYIDYEVYTRARKFSVLTVLYYVCAFS